MKTRLDTLSGFRTFFVNILKYTKQYKYNCTDESDYPIILQYDANETI